MTTTKIPYKLKIKLRRLADLANKRSQLENQCMAELEALGLVNDDWEFVSTDAAKAKVLGDYWADTSSGFGGSPEKLIELLESMPLAKKD